MTRRGSPNAALAGAATLNIGLGTLYAWSVLAPPLREEFDAGGEVSTVFSVALVAFCVTVVAGGWLTDRWRPRRLALASGVAAVVGLAGSAAAPTLGWVVVGYGALFGVGNGIGYATAVAVAGKAFDRRRGLALGITVGGYAASPLVASPLLQLGIVELGWRATVLVLAGATGAAALAAAWLLGGATEAYRLTGSAEGVAPEGTRLAVMRTAQGWLLWAVFLCGSFPALMTLAHLTVVADARGLSAFDGANLVALLGLANAAGRVGVGAVSDVVGRRVTLPGSMAGNAAAAGLVAVLPGAGVLYPATVLLGLAYGALAGLVPAATSDLFGTRDLGRNFAVVFSAWGVAGAIAPTVGAVALERTQGAVAAYTVAAVVALLGTAAALEVRRSLS